MDDKEKKISDYIDKLNIEQKPSEHNTMDESSDSEEIYDTVRKIRSLKEPVMPEGDYPRRLALAVANQISKKAHTKKKKRRAWIGGMASVAAILILAIMMNFILPSDNENIVYAMEQAYKEIKAYHGILEIVETNAEGKQTTQSKIDVWVDKEGHYYIKGLEGSVKDLITANNGQVKWQIRPEENQVHVFSAFPDAYRFVFELGNEIDEVKNASSTKVVGEDEVAGRKCYVLEVSPEGGEPYKIWVDKETDLPLQKQYAMQKSIQYTVTYSEIKFESVIPEALITYEVPPGYDEINENPEQLVNSLDEVEELAGFTPSILKNIPGEYILDSIAVVPSMKSVKVNLAAKDNGERVTIIQGESDNEFKPSPTAIIGSFDEIPVEIQSPIHEELGILGAGGIYAGVTDVSSIRWQKDDFEYTIVGETDIEELGLFAESLTNEEFEMPSIVDDNIDKPQIEVPIDLEIEEYEQKSADSGSSPWKLDPVFVAQVFVSLKISPEGITGEYPIAYEDLEVIQNDGTDTIIHVNNDKAPIEKVYLKRLIRQDSTGIWTVTGYDPSDKE